MDQGEGREKPFSSCSSFSPSPTRLGMSIMSSGEWRKEREKERRKGGRVNVKES